MNERLRVKDSRRWGKEINKEINYENGMRKRMGNIKKERETEGEREKFKSDRKKGEKKNDIFGKKM